MRPSTALMVYAKLSTLMMSAGRCGDVSAYRVFAYEKYYLRKEYNIRCMDDTCWIESRPEAFWEAAIVEIPGNRFMDNARYRKD